MKCRVIGLESQTDRLEKIPEEMAKIGIEWEFFPAVDIQGYDLMRTISNSFIEVLKEVEGDLLVCESDVIFINQAKTIFQKALHQLPKDYDLLYLGGNIHEPASRYSDNLFWITKGVHCNHAILYSDKGRKKMIEYYNPLGDENPRIDDWLYHVGQNKMSCFICSPMIAYQRPCYSTVHKKVVDYYIEMRSNEIEFL
jgi:GR25 family glycosyltransferase involved in LPS biosynthesis